MKMGNHRVLLDECATVAVDRGPLDVGTLDAEDGDRALVSVETTADHHTDHDQTADRDARGDEPRRPIRFVDLEEAHRPLRDDILASWGSLLDTGGFIGGDHVAEFESAFADYVGVRHAIGVANGTDALALILRALDIGPGDEVITVAHTFVATVEAIVSTGATPVLVDVDEATGTMSPEALEPAITSHTRAVIPVHLYGQTADMGPIRSIADAHGIAVVEDACQAHGATYAGRNAGSLGTAAAFSFYPGKNLGAAGDAGGVTTDDDELADRIRQLRDHGQAEKSIHVVSGFNSRLDAVQAVVLGIKLPHLDDWNGRRRLAAKEYGARLDSSLVQLPEEIPGRRHVYHLFVVRHPRRDLLRSALADRGVPTGMHYPTPVHLHPAFHSLGRGEGTFPGSERWAAHGVSLPMHPHLTADQIEHVVSSVNRGVS